MDKDVVHIYSGPLIAIKRNEIVPFAEKVMDLETVIQSEVIQKEKNKCCILTHTCEIQENSIDELICKAEIETDVENKRMDTGLWGETEWEWIMRLN